MESNDGDLAFYEETLARVRFDIQTKRAEIELLSRMLENAHGGIASHEREAASLRALIDRMRAGGTGRASMHADALSPGPGSAAMSVTGHPHRLAQAGPDRTPTGPAPDHAPDERAPVPAEVSREPTDEELRQSVHALGPEELRALRVALDSHFGGTRGGPGPSEEAAIKPGRNGRAPRGFGKAVRSIAHDSIAAAARPLGRAQIVSAVARSGLPMPARSLAQKVSKILVNDPDLINIKGEGYWFRREAVGSE